jgi:hypothetical protein
MRYLLALPLLIVSGIPAEAQNGIMHQNLGGTYDYGTGSNLDSPRVFILLQAARHGQKTPASALPEQDTIALMTVTIPIKAKRNNKTRRAMSAFGPKRTSLVAPHMSALDPKRTCRASKGSLMTPERTSLCLDRPLPTGGIVQLLGGRCGVMEWSSSEWRGA